MERSHKGSTEQTDHRSETSIRKTCFRVPISRALLENLHRARGNNRQNLMFKFVLCTYHDSTLNHVAWLE